MTNREKLIESICVEATEWRREMHRNPQTMFEEEFASAFVSRKLTEWGIAHERGIAETGIVATVPGRQNHSGRVVAFRADMDALNIVEKSGQPWSSETPGKMHGCGHDGHTATLLTLAMYLNKTRNFDGEVRLIFQPAEETGRGAKQMLEEGLLERFPFDEIYGYHNWPYLPRGVFAIRSGAMMAAVDEFAIRLQGKGGHAAMPHLTLDAIPAAAQLVLALQTMVSRETDPVSAAVVSVTNVAAGSGAVNVISGMAELRGTVRSFSPELRDNLESRIKEVAKSIANTFRLSCEVEYIRTIDPVLNHAEATSFCQTAAAKIVGEENVREIAPILGGEDFGAFLEARPGAFIAIGQAEEDSTSPHNFGLHSPNYDFNDRILPIAAGYFAELAETRLPVD